MIKREWAKLSAKSKRIITVLGAFAIIVAAVSLFSGDGEKKDRRTNRDRSIRHVITDTNTREVGLDSLSANLDIVKKEKDKLRRDLNRLEAQLKAKSGTGKGSDVDNEIRQLTRKLDAVQKSNEKLAARLDEQDSASKKEAKSDSSGDAVSVGNKPTASNSTLAANENVNYDNPEQFFKDAPTPVINPSTGEGEGDGPDTASRGLMISSFSAAPKEESEEERKERKAKDNIYIPSGSILSGVLINGMDAPTAQGARQDPFPSTLRIQKEAILPNRYRADVRECFLILSGYGDLSSERAYLRSENLSCIKNDGQVIETKLAAYAVGEDGKAGIRGRLVSKQGQIIAKSLMAGFMSGAAQAFQVDSVPTINLDGRGNQYQSNDFSGTLAKGAAAKGASTALDRIAQFYIDMAEGIFPVIEVDAGRQIEVIMTKGAALTVRGSKADLE